jgi:hypothetical protein
VRHKHVSKLAKTVRFAGTRMRAGNRAPIHGSADHQRQRHPGRAGKAGREDGVVNLKAETFFPLRLDQASQIVRSHDYH